MKELDCATEGDGLCLRVCERSNDLEIVPEYVRTTDKERDMLAKLTVRSPVPVPERELDLGCVGDKVMLLEGEIEIVCVRDWSTVGECGDMVRESESDTEDDTVGLIVDVQDKVLSFVTDRVGFVSVIEPEFEAVVVGVLSKVSVGDLVRSGVGDLDPREVVRL